MTQNTKYHSEIRRWDTEQLISVLEINGLYDCSEAIRNLEIDGESFLNLTEGQLAFWRKYLNNIQVRRFWSIIQLARERPQDFVGNVGNSLKPTPHQEIERIRSPIAHSLENMLGQKPGIIPGSKPKQDSLPEYENNETLVQMHHSKRAYQNLPPKPQQQQQQQQNIRNVPPEENLPMKPTENEKHIFQNRHLPPIPVQREPIPQNPDINVMKHEKIRSNSFLHSNVRVLPTPTINETHIVTPPSNLNNTTNRYHRVPSPGVPSRALPEPPKTENMFPLPPNVVPLIPNWKLEHGDEEYQGYDEIDHYKTKQWYREINRKQANDLLKGKPNGTFIARPSKQENYECSLSIIYNHRIYNLAIMKQDDKLVIGNQEFASVNEIIEFFMKNQMILNGVNNEDIVVTLRQI